MTQEKKAIDIVKQMIADGHVSQEVAEKYFPELAESGDEKIRKSLLWQYKGFKSTDYYDDGITFGDVVKWLEKQGEKDKLIKELGEYKVKYTQEVLEKHLNSMNNEDDERIRKILIGWVNLEPSQSFSDGFTKKEILAWLENKVRNHKVNQHLKP